MKPSQESKTDTTNNLSESFKQAVAALEKVASLLPEKEKVFDPLQYWISTLKEEDIILEYKIVAHTKNGEIINVSGVNNMPRIFDESMLPEAPTNFENAFNAGVVRPTLNAFMKIMRDKIEDFKKSSTPSANMLMLPTNNTEQKEFISAD